MDVSWDAACFHFVVSAAKMSFTFVHAVEQLSIDITVYKDFTIFHISIEGSFEHIWLIVLCRKDLM